MTGKASRLIGAGFMLTGSLAIAASMMAPAIAVGAWIAALAFFGAAVVAFVVAAKKEDRRDE